MPQKLYHNCSSIFPTSPDVSSSWRKTTLRAPHTGLLSSKPARHHLHFAYLILRQGDNLFRMSASRRIRKMRSVGEDEYSQVAPYQMSISLLCISMSKYPCKRRSRCTPALKQSGGSGHEDALTEESSSFTIQSIRRSYRPSAQHEFRYAEVCVGRIGIYPVSSLQNI